MTYDPDHPQSDETARLAKLERFVALVTECRQAQRTYFKTHGGLDEAKKLERAVDEAIVELSTRPQTRLF